MKLKFKNLDTLDLMHRMVEESQKNIKLIDKIIERSDRSEWPPLITRHVGDFSERIDFIKRELGYLEEDIRTLYGLEE